MQLVPRAPGLLLLIARLAIQDFTFSLQALHVVPHVHWVTTLTHRRSSVRHAIFPAHHALEPQAHNVHHAPPVTFFNPPAPLAAPLVPQVITQKLEAV